MGKVKDTVFVVSCYGEPNLDWLEEYSDNIVVIDKTKNNVGYNIFSYMDWIVNNYNNLPETVIFLKNNLLQRHITKPEFDKIVNNKTFTPILTQNHGTHLPVSYYEDGLYHEINDSWYFGFHTYKYFNSYPLFAELMGLENPRYLRFAPGGCYIVPRENILKRSKEFYEKLRSFVDWTQEPAEAHAIERALYEIWK
jgi:hypothetical protein